MSDAIEPSYINPFQYLNPDDIADPKEALDLFVDVFKDYYLVLNPGNSFIHGPRGSGKSMMFRIMQPDCQKIRLNCDVHKLPFFSINIPIKDSGVDLQELNFLTGKHAEHMFNEHFLVLYFSIRIFEVLAKEDFTNYEGKLVEVESYVNSIFIKSASRARWNIDKAAFDLAKDITSYFQTLLTLCNDLKDSFVDEYLSRLDEGFESFPYKGPKCSYNNFLLPIIKGIRELSFLPDGPLFLLVDDADELNFQQTRILNSWVSYRTTKYLSFKISTQLGYKTYFTSSGSRIDHPHDFFNVSLVSAYTKKRIEAYKQNVKEIVEKRLIHKANIDKTAEEFFPLNIKQEEAYNKLFNELKTKFDYDYAYRCARPIYMTSLANNFAYSYAGFDQLVHLSSGIIRNFIDLASEMYDAAFKNLPKNKNVVDHIPVRIQDDEILKYSSALKSKLEIDVELIEQLNEEEKQKLKRYTSLYNLVESLGKSFRIFLMSESTERRKFSFYFEGEPSNNIKKILRLAEKEGFFHKNILGNKSGLGKADLYVMNRMLAPIYELDPFSFSGYMYLSVNALELAIAYPAKFAGKVKQRDIGYDSKKNNQLKLFMDLTEEDKDD